MFIYMYMSLDMLIMVVSSVVPLSLETAPAVVLQARASRVLFLNRCWLLEEPAADAEGILHLCACVCTCMQQIYMYMYTYVCCLHIHVRVHAHTRSMYMYMYVHVHTLWN